MQRNLQQLCFNTIFLTIVVTFSVADYWLISLQNKSHFLQLYTARKSKILAAKRTCFNTKFRSASNQFLELPWTWRQSAWNWILLFRSSCQLARLSFCTWVSLWLSRFPVTQKFSSGTMMSMWRYLNIWIHTQTSTSTLSCFIQNLRVVWLCDREILEIFPWSILTTSPIRKDWIWKLCTKELRWRWSLTRRKRLNNCGQNFT